jgi:hypothetical protein
VAARARTETECTSEWGGGRITSRVQTHGSGVAEMNRIRVFDAPSLIHPVDSVSGGARRMNRVSTAKSSGGVISGSHTRRAVNIGFRWCMGLHGPCRRRLQRRRQLQAGLPHLLVLVCTRTSKGMRLIEPCDSVDLTEAIACGITNSSGRSSEDPRTL